MGIDMYFLSLLNGSNSVFMDALMVTLTDGLTWIALYIALAILVIKNNKTVAQILLIFACVFACVLFSGIFNDLIVKPYFERPRPINDFEVQEMVNMSSGYLASGYSFFSSHSANTFAIAVFFSLLTRSRMISISLISWAVVNAYTRLYLGVHWFSDVAIGMLWGILIGIVSYIVYNRLYYRISPHAKYISSHYTSTGYCHTDIDMVISVLVFTLLYSVIISL
ncbi:MAG: phosphatase PAP2 family protein [Prevotella sp.]|nr:phosphatase PAP2 family protein [Prevotella sp.]MCI5571241.1 phosphatase PAP2 family protein [Prevotella sp.]MDY4990464.1 phosphatase PAP2 family protein [Prevotella sp.]MEE1153435.1 phosphatase PAP2 family protein [Prevotella sp.]